MATVNSAPTVNISTLSTHVQAPATVTRPPALTDTQGPANTSPGLAHVSSTQHLNTSQDSKLETLKINLQNVVNLLAEKETEIKKLEARVNMMEEEVKQFSCGVKEVSNSPVETHTVKEHVEKLLKCEYWTCNYTARTSTVMKRHVTMKHKIERGFVYPTSPESEECYGCGQTFQIDHSYAMHLYEAHKSSFDCDHCHKHYPGDDMFFSIHLKSCTVPCNGNPRCPCRHD